MQAYGLNCANARRQSGSWLVNLILVIFIVLIVAAVLFPVFVPHGQPARKTMCLHNLKQLAVALHTYSNDYDSKLPSSSLVNHSKRWNSRDFLRFGTKLGAIPPKGRPETYVQVLYDHVKSKDIMFCPSDSASDQPDSSSNVSYFWKTAIDKAWYGEKCEKPCRKEMDFPYMADQIVLYEHSGFHCGEDGIKNGTRINVAYLDTHVKTIYVKNATFGDPKNCAANSDGEPMFFNCEIGEDGTTIKPLPDGVPARYIDPGRYCDKF